MRRTYLYPEWTKPAWSDDDETPNKVYVSAVLAHPINVSYEQYQGQSVGKVNEVPVKNMRHFVSLIAGISDGDVVIDFAPEKVRRGDQYVDDGSRTFIVLDAREMKACEAEILEADKIPNWCSPELLEPHEEAASEPEPTPAPKAEA